MIASPARVREELQRAIVGQSAVVDTLMAGLIAGGHVLLEGPPGVGKTQACRVLAAALDASFSRVQFTADMLPSDVTGCRIYDMVRAEFVTMPGPIFANVVLADEINRAPAKVQSAMLEAMQERRVTIAARSYPLPDPFIVMATMNPIESEGTYPLPLAQLDRFMLKVDAGFPMPDEEIEILQRYATGAVAAVRIAASAADVAVWRRAASAVHVDERLFRYAVGLARATRSCAEIAHGAGPRAAMSLIAAARARALLNGRAAIVPDDVRVHARSVLAHRVVYTDAVTFEGRDTGAILDAVIASVPVP